MTDLATIERTHVDLSTGEPKCAHIVAPTPDATAMELVMRSRIEGTRIEAICGHVFVATLDATKLPLCSRCKEIREEFRPDQDPSDIPS